MKFDRPRTIERESRTIWLVEFHLTRIYKIDSSSQSTFSLLVEIISEMTKLVVTRRKRVASPRQERCGCNNYRVTLIR